MERSTCVTCGAALRLQFGSWWDDSGFEANTHLGHPWHKHEPQPQEIQAVYDWSIRIHGPSDRHDWCCKAARALLAGEDPPEAGPGTAFYRRSTAGDRLDTIRRLLNLEGTTS